MGLEETIKKEEEELKKLQEAEEKGLEDGDSTVDDQSDDDEPTDEEADGTEDDDDASDDDIGSDEDGDDDSEGDDDEDADVVENEDKKKSKKQRSKEEQSDVVKARMERKKRLKTEAENAELRRRIEEGSETKADKDKLEEQGSEDDKEWLAGFRQREEQQALRTQAAEELSTLENEFMTENPDYKDASTHMIKTMYKAATQFYPNLSQKQAIELVQNKVLEIAGQAARNGQNPAEVLYQMAFDTYGFDPANVEKPAPKKNAAAENLKKKAKNRKRSANGLAGGGQSAGARATIHEAEKMSVADFSNMSETEIDDLIAQAAS